MDNRQYCKGCEKILTPSLFITNGKSYRTCEICRFQNKANYQRRKQQADQILIEFDDLSDFMYNIIEGEYENKENETNTKIKFSFTINIVTLEGDSKDRANDIVKVISDVDEYIWV